MKSAKKFARNVRNARSAGNVVVANAVNATLIAMATATPNAVVHVMPTAGVIVMPTAGVIVMLTAGVIVMLNRVLTAAGSVKNVNVRRCHLSLTC